MLHGKNRIKIKLCLTVFLCTGTVLKKSNLFHGSKGPSSCFSAILFCGFLYPLCLKLSVRYKQVFRVWRLWFTDGIMRLTRTSFTHMAINRSYTYRWCIHCFLILFVDGSFCLITVCIATARSGSSKLAIPSHALPVSTGVRILLLTVHSTWFEGGSEWASVNVCCG